MELNSKIYEELKRHNNIITTSQVISLGFSKTLLTKYVKEGLLERSRHGIYTLPGSAHDDMYTMMLKSDKIVFSHDTALFLDDLSDRTPFIHSVTIPSNATLPHSLKGECSCYYIKPELHSLGMIERRTTFGNLVRCYNPERTVCDLIRSRNRTDEEIVITAMKNYAASKEKNLRLLAVYAERFHVLKNLKKYMEVLL